MAARGGNAIAAAKLQRMCALSQAFQDETGDVGYESTARRVHLTGVTINSQFPRPFAVLQSGTDYRVRRSGGGMSPEPLASGAVILYLNHDVDPQDADDRFAAEQKADSFFGLVQDEIMSLSDQDDPGSTDGSGHLNIRTSQRTVFERVALSERKSLGDFHWCAILFEWGIL